MRPLFRAGLLFVAATSTACAARREPPYYLENNAAGALDCPQASVVYAGHADGEFGRRARREYTAGGCGRTVTYVCTSNGLDCKAK